MAAELCIPHFLEEIHRPTMVAPVGPDKDDPASAANVNIQKQHIVGISGRCSCFLSFCFFDAEFYVTSWLENPFSGELDRDDIELLLHFFWLPHSHGPKAQITLNYFKQLLEDAHIIQKLGLYNKRDGEMVDEPHGYKNFSNEYTRNMVFKGTWSQSSTRILRVFCCFWVLVTLISTLVTYFSVLMYP